MYISPQPVGMIKKKNYRLSITRETWRLGEQTKQKESTAVTLRYFQLFFILDVCALRAHLLQLTPRRLLFAGTSMKMVVVNLARAISALFVVILLNQLVISVLGEDNLLVNEGSKSSQGNT